MMPHISTLSYFEVIESSRASISVRLHSTNCLIQSLGSPTLQTLLISRSLFLKQCHCSLPHRRCSTSPDFPEIFSLLSKSTSPSQTPRRTLDASSGIKWVGKLLGSIGHPKKHHRGKITSPVPTHMSPLSSSNLIRLNHHWLSKYYM